MKNIVGIILFLMALSGVIYSPSMAQGSEYHDEHMVNVIAEDYSFEAPDEIPSGWSNIRFSNKGQEPHLLLFSRLPEGKTVDDYLSEAGPPFNEIWYQLRNGEIKPEQISESLVREMPAWFFEVQFLGGVGLVMPDSVAETTVNLSPGDYAIECYSKTEDGEIHFMEGMARPIKVKEKKSGNKPPEEDLLVTIKSDQMNIEGDFIPGKQTVKVLVEEEPPKQAFGQNVHVVHLEQEADIEEIVKWFNWYTPTGLRSPSPDQATFIGGMHFLPVDRPGFFKVDLKPGRYLFVSGPTARFGVFKEIIIE
ncbi:MAG: hypothetical protein ACQER7_11020 [Bacteroidota bacterium]